MKINYENIRIRPSAVDSFYGCAYQWGKTFLEGIPSITNNRAAIGTAIHAGIEASWTEAMSSGKAEHNLSLMTDAAIDNMKAQHDDCEISYGEDENINTSNKDIVSGILAWKDDVSQFLALPKAVETFFKIDIAHPLVSELGGTVDYLAPCRGGYIIDDVKTSKRAVTTSGYTTQQSIYKLLAEANGTPVVQNRIQSVILKKSSEGRILTLEPNIEQARTLVNGMLDALELVAKDVAPIEVILRGNPKHTFCSSKFCAHYSACPFVKGRV